MYSHIGSHLHHICNVGSQSAYVVEHTAVMAALANLRGKRTQRQDQLRRSSSIELADAPVKFDEGTAAALLVDRTTAQTSALDRGDDEAAGPYGRTEMRARASTAHRAMGDMQSRRKQFMNLGLFRAQITGQLQFEQNLKGLVVYMVRAPPDPRVRICAQCARAGPAGKLYWDAVGSTRTW